MWRKLTWPILFTCMLCAVETTLGRTPTATWDNGGLGNLWSTGQNWSGSDIYPDDTPPDSNTDASIDAGGVAAPLIDWTVRAVARRVMVYGRVYWEPGRDMFVAPADLHITGGTLDTSDSIRVGGGGTIIMTGGTVNCHGDLSIAGDDMTGNDVIGRFNLYGGTITVDGGLGFYRLGLLDITAGTLLVKSSESSPSFVQELLADDFITAYGSSDDNDGIVTTVVVDHNEYTSVTAVPRPPLLVPSQYPTIQAAINDCNSGSIILVGDGTHSGPGNRNISYMDKVITIRSENGPENCIIDCEGAGPGFLFHNGEGPSCVLEGLTITNGYGTGWGGGAISCDRSSPIIANCILRGNYARWGGGINCMDSAPYIMNCLIVNNTASLSEYGGGIRYKNSTPTIIHCTITGNSAGRGGAIGEGGSTAMISNCILWGNLPSEILSSAPERLIMSFSNVEDSWPGEGNIDADPVFRSQSDYRLTFGSPCIDSGTANPRGGLPVTDLDGVGRPFDGDYDANATPDMGAYEFHQNPSNPVLALAPSKFRFTCYLDGPNPPAKMLSIWNSGGGILDWRIAENCSWLTVDPNSGYSAGEVDSISINVDPNGLASDLYSYSLTVTDPCDPNNTRFVPVEFRVGPTLHVPEDYNNIQAAVDAAFDGDEVVVADGVYRGPGNRDIDFKRKAIVVKSENGPNSCIIDCEGTVTESHRGFYFHSGEDEDSIVDGFTITNGDCSAAGFPEGGGIFCLNADTNPTIRNCIVIENSAWSGGGISCWQSSAKIMNCTIANNHALSDKGGGILCWMGSSAEITGCTIVANSAKKHGGGLFFYAGRPILKNSIIWGNTVESDLQQIRIAAGSALLVSYCDVQGYWAGTGNKDVDPGFVDPTGKDYHLLPNSPCIDGGDPNYSPYPEEWDIDGEPRVMNNRVDIGSDEISDMVADFDADGSIGIGDFNSFSLTWVTSAGEETWSQDCDLVESGTIDLADFAVFARGWLKECDTEAPSTPANLTVRDITESVVSLEWDPSTDNRTTVGYKILRDGEYQGWTTRTDFVDVGLEPSTAYTYQICAYDAAYNDSSLSDSCKVTTTW